VERYVTPEEFTRWRETGMRMGFHHVESSPLTRSSYHARQQVEGTAQVEELGAALESEAVVAG